MARIALTLIFLFAAIDARAQTCGVGGTWIDPSNRQNIESPSFLKRIASQSVVVLGESHTVADHHRWQLQTLSALHALNPNLVLGFEAFPRSSQTILDAWVRGDLNEKDFLERSGWHQVWRHDPTHYLPLLHFARLNRVPLIALNVERKMIARVGREGWAAIPEAAREGIGDPRPASPAYRRALGDVLGQHEGNDNGLERFVQAQTVWDRAMAEALAEAHRKGGSPLVVAIVGRGHTEYGYGIPAQLADLGITDAANLVAWDFDRPCESLKDSEGTPVADAVFLLGPPREAPKAGRMILGVHIEDGEDGVAINSVVADSVAARTGLQAGDIVSEAAGSPMTKARTLAATVARQAPGTWLPLTIERDGRTLELIAKFPAAVDP